MSGVFFYVYEELTIDIIDRCGIISSERRREMRKVRAGITIDKELYEKLRKMAEEDRRSFSSLVESILYKAVMK